MTCTPAFHYMINKKKDNGEKEKKMAEKKILSWLLGL